MKKQKFLTLFSILALCVCSLFIGVWAAKTATVTTGGSINFTATGVNCKVSGAIQNSTASLKTLETLTFSASDSVDTKSWGTSNAIAFDNNETPINIVITVENLVDRALYAQVTNAVFGDGSQFDVTLSTDLLTLSTAGTGTITITITPKPMDVSVTKDYSFNVVLSATKPLVVLEASEYANLTFTTLSGQTVDGLQAVSVKENSSNLPSGEVIIPSYVKKNGEKCVVTTLPANAFGNSTELTDLTIPETITSMGMGLLSDSTTISRNVYINSAYVAGLDKINCNLTSVGGGVWSITNNYFRSSGSTDSTDIESTRIYVYIPQSYQLGSLFDIEGIYVGGGAFVFIKAEIITIDGVAYYSFYENLLALQYAAMS